MIRQSDSTFNKAQTWAQNCINLFACQNYWCRPSTARVSPAFSAVPFPRLPFFSYLPVLARLQRLVEGALFNAENGMLPQCKGKGCDLCRGSDDRTPTVLVIFFFFFNGPELSCSVFELKEEAFRHRGSSSPGRAVGVTSKYWCKEATPKEREKERERRKKEWEETSNWNPVGLALRLLFSNFVVVYQLCPPSCPPSLQHWMNGLYSESWECRRLQS